jgi:hypothetical protein
VQQAAMNEIRGLNCKGCVIIYVGSNYINKNETSIGLKYIMNFILQNQHINIIIIPALHRYDLIKSSGINREIQTFNRKLSKIIKVMQHVTMLDVTLDRKDFTRHALFLNSLEREKVALHIGQHITKLLTKQENSIFSLPWIDDSKGFNGMENMLSLEGFANKVRVFGRSKKPPTTRTDDFYGSPRKNVKVKLQKLSSKSVLINESNRLNSENITQCYNSKLAMDSAQPINTKYGLVSGNEMFSRNN